jgi:hypothetical protein
MPAAMSACVAISAVRAASTQDLSGRSSPAYQCRSSAAIVQKWLRRATKPITPPTAHPDTASTQPESSMIMFPPFDRRSRHRHSRQESRHLVGLPPCPVLMSTVPPDERSSSRPGSARPSCRQRLLSRRQLRKLNDLPTDPLVPAGWHQLPFPAALQSRLCMLATSTEISGLEIE